ncbi:MAG: hypothetical protein IPM18_01370 [Phycisphaerales bacterium]|nr:hypothetical protein [Phycisphaerales bacterium]
MRRVSRKNTVLLVTLVAAALPLLSLGCKRQEERPQGATGPNATTMAATAPAAPDYTLDAGLEERYPAVSRFLRQFVETSLAGDYMGYRRLVSRRADPESRSRFEQALGGLQRLTVEEIEPLQHPELPPGTHRVVVRVEFRPGEPIALRRGDENRLAILVFEEEGELRMVFAPAMLQPERQPSTDEADDEFPTTQPDFPWDDGFDY